MIELYKGKKKNKTKLCGRCNVPCETAWCPTLENPEEFEDYKKDQKDENKKENN